MYSLIFICALVVANLSVAMFGPWVSPINAFLLIGLDLSLRDKLHDQWNGNPVKIGSLIGVAGLVSYLINPASGMIAIASVCAFCASMVVDSVVYQKMKDRPWFERANTSNIAGAAVDSLIFPTIAFGELIWLIVLLQFVAKVSGGLIWSCIFKRKMTANPMALTKKS